MTGFKRFALYAGPLFGICLGLWLSGLEYSDDICITAGLTVWVAIWWVFEPVPIPVSSLLPLALLHLLLATSPLPPESLRPK